jgi:nicotinamide-nucleotide amidase
MSAAPRAAVLLTGSELLDGRVHDRNGAMLTASLAARGARVTHVLTVPDDAQQIVAALRFSLDRGLALLVVSGGLGTTHDDLTTAAVAEAVGRDLAEDAQALAWVEERTRSICRSRRLQFKPAFAQMRRQALLPAGSRPLPPAGAAPGFTLVAGGTTIVVLPGVPAELEPMWTAVADELQRQEFFPSVRTRTVRIFGAGELQVAPVVAGSAHDLLDVSVTAAAGEVTVCLRHADGEEAETQAHALVDALAKQLPVFSTDGRTIDETVTDRLRALSATVAAAESCTGGLLGARLTAQAGSSDYFVGGVVSYANQVKEHLLQVPVATIAARGAVSEEVALDMATGVVAATGATFGLATTGIAGPAGGRQEKTVGLVYVAVAGPGVRRAVRHLFRGDREAVRVQAVTAALHLLREAMGT